ncbi:SMC-Scp complex subunit ScpB [Sansalvadorimonas verongulae]|uniref:SMC-Scp complex subunit ScpB n=1 Tax=Sansalvadorimonas verongulae TaxID=2172824 RepID=UPI0012BC6F33|nr:SMC-Scp complex subunit ScpB [Sansalvadorimonas verongulae]MTI13002.1 SMC-Scp complex subunit ScpB [Sansalvadorimonas verongulae]
MSEQDHIEELPDEAIEEGAPQFYGEAPIVPVIEAALMAAGKPLTLEQLAGLFDDNVRPSKPEMKQAMADLAEQCEGRGFELKEVASGWRFQVRQELAPWVGRLWDEKPQRYTRALLETLSLIAYRQPITRGEIEDIRGVSVSTNIIRTLQEREWVRVVGHRDVPGRPAMYATTRQFLDYFNLRNLDELPPLSELRDLDAMAQKLEGGAGDAQPELLDDDGTPEEAVGEVPEGDAAALVSVEAAQAFQEEGEETIEKLFSELDEMEGDLTLTYQDYDPLEHKAPEAESEKPVETEKSVETEVVKVTETADTTAEAENAAAAEEDELERAIAEERVALAEQSESETEDNEELVASVDIEQTYQYKPRFDDDRRRDEQDEGNDDDISSLMDELLSDRDEDDND